MKAKSIKPSLTNKKKIQRRQYWFVAFLLAYPLANFLVFYLWNNINAIIITFQRVNPETFDKYWVGVDNWTRMFRDLSREGNLLEYAFRGMYLWCLSLIGMPFNLLFGYILFMKIRGATAYRMMLMIPSMVSGLVFGMLFSQLAENVLPILMKDLFGIETLSLLLDPRFNIATIIIYSFFIGFAGTILIYMNSMRAATDEIIEAAKMDGATQLKIFWHICCPVSIPTVEALIVPAVATIFAPSGGVYYVFYQYSAPENMMTLSFYIFTLTKNYTQSRVDYSYSGTLALFFSLITFPLVILVKKLFDKLNPMEDKNV